MGVEESWEGGSCRCRESAGVGGAGATEGCRKAWVAATHTRTRRVARRRRLLLPLCWVIMARVVVGVDQGGAAFLLFLLLLAVLLDLLGQGASMPVGCGWSKWVVAQGDETKETCRGRKGRVGTRVDAPRVNELDTHWQMIWPAKGSAARAAVWGNARRRTRALPQLSTCVAEATHRHTLTLHRHTHHRWPSPFSCPPSMQTPAFFSV